jgi:hypothetical protein
VPLVSSKISLACVIAVEASSIDTRLFFFLKSTNIKKTEQFAAFKLTDI